MREKYKKTLIDLHLCFLRVNVSNIFCLFCSDSNLFLCNMVYFQHHFFLAHSYQALTKHYCFTFFVVTNFTVLILVHSSGALTNYLLFYSRSSWWKFWQCFSSWEYGKTLTLIPSLCFDQLPLNIVQILRYALMCLQFIRENEKSTHFCSQLLAKNGLYVSVLFDFSCLFTRVWTGCIVLSFPPFALDSCFCHLRSVRVFCFFPV